MKMNEKQINKWGNFMKMPNNNSKNINNLTQTMNFCFSKEGRKVLVQCAYGTTVSEVCKKYCIKVDEPDLDEIKFLYRSTLLNSKDNTKIEEKFNEDSGNLKIEVIPPSSFIG